jgi:hypothetical protein
MTSRLVMMKSPHINREIHLLMSDACILSVVGMIGQTLRRLVSMVLLMVHFLWPIAQHAPRP